MATNKNNTKAQDKGFVMRAVDAPPAPAPRRGLYTEVVSRLVEQPGQWFLVRTYNSPQSAQSGRSAVAKCAKTLGHRIQVQANGADLYAKAERKRGRQPASKV